MVQENSTSNKRSSKDLNKMLPPHLRAHGIKNAKYSSPLKNQVNLKDEKSTFLLPNNENINPNALMGDRFIGRSKSTNEAISDYKQKMIADTMHSSPFDIKKSNSLNNTNYNYKPTLMNINNNNTSQDLFDHSSIHSINDSTKENVNSTSQRPYSPSSTHSTPLTSLGSTPKAVKRRSASLPTSPMDLYPHNGLRNNGSFGLTRSTSRGGSDDKIQQILGDGAVDSLERNNALQLNESIGMKGNRDKIQQILIDGNNKNKNKESHSSTSSSISSLSNPSASSNSSSAPANAPTNNSHLNGAPTPASSLTVPGMKKSASTTLKLSSTKQNHDGNSNLLKKPASTSLLSSPSPSKPTTKKSLTSLNETPIERGGSVKSNLTTLPGDTLTPPPSILLKGSSIERSGSNKSVSILDNKKNGGMIERSGSNRSVSILDNKKNGGVGVLKNSMNGLHSANKDGKNNTSLGGKVTNEPQLTFALPPNSASSHMKQLSTSSTSTATSEEFHGLHLIKNGVFPSSSIRVNTLNHHPANIAAPMSAPLQQGAAPRPFNNDEAMASLSKNGRANSFGLTPRNSQNDIFSFAARKREEERQKQEKKNSFKISKESLVFSCYIEKLSSRRKYQKRILRFDGIFLICLSQKKKQKLPANTTFTTVNPPCFSDNSEDGKTYLEVIKQLYSNLSPGPEFSSPLIAIEDSKSKGSSNGGSGNSNPNLKARHYYLPKWIINVKDIISVRPLIHPDLLSLANATLIYKNMEPELQHYTTGDLDKDTKTFIIITRTGVFYVIRAYTEREFNRWLYILTRSKEILEELVDPRLMVPDALPPPPSTSPSPAHPGIGRTTTNTTTSTTTLSNGSSLNSEDSQIRRFMAREEEEEYDRPSTLTKSSSRRSVAGGLSTSSHHSRSSSNGIPRSGSTMSNTNVDLMSLYTNKSTASVVLKTEYTDSIDRQLPKDPLHLHYTIFDHWKGVLDQLYAIDRDIYNSVTKAENSELVSILKDAEGETTTGDGQDPAAGTLGERREGGALSPSNPTPLSPSFLPGKKPNLGDSEAFGGSASGYAPLSAPESRSTTYDPAGTFGHARGQSHESQPSGGGNASDLETMVKPTPYLNHEQMAQQWNRLRPRPRSGSAPPITTILQKYQLQEEGPNRTKEGPATLAPPSSLGEKSSERRHSHTSNTSLSSSTSSSTSYRKRDPVSLTSLRPMPPLTPDAQPSSSHSNPTLLNPSGTLEGGKGKGNDHPSVAPMDPLDPLDPTDPTTLHDQTFTVDTIEQPQIQTLTKTSDNHPMKQQRYSIYRPNVTESIRIPAYDPTLKQPFIQSIPWDSDLTFTLMGLLRIFHRLSGVPFVEDGETEKNTPPPPIPRWYYQFCVKSIPVYIIQLQNMLIDYLQELEYQQGKQDEIDSIPPELRLRNKNLLAERYRVVQGALDSFIKLSSLWEDIVSQWKLEMMHSKFKAGSLPINENEMDRFLLQHVDVEDVLNIHSKIKDYLGKEMLIGCRNLLKLFEKEEE